MNKRTLSVALLNKSVSLAVGNAPLDGILRNKAHTRATIGWKGEFHSFDRSWVIFVISLLSLISSKDCFDDLTPRKVSQLSNTDIKLRDNDTQTSKNVSSNLSGLFLTSGVCDSVNLLN